MPKKITIYVRDLETGDVHIFPTIKQLAAWFDVHSPNLSTIINNIPQNPIYRNKWELSLTGKDWVSEGVWDGSSNTNYEYALHNNITGKAYSFVSVDDVAQFMGWAPYAYNWEFLQERIKRSNCVITRTLIKANRTHIQLLVGKCVIDCPTRRKAMAVMNVARGCLSTMLSKNLTDPTGKYRARLYKGDAPWGKPAGRVTGPGKGTLVFVATHEDGTTISKSNGTKLALALGVTPSSISLALRENRPVKGWTCKRVPIVS